MSGLVGKKSKKSVRIKYVRKIGKIIAKRLAPKLAPYVGAADWALTSYATIKSLRGYKYTKIIVRYELWSIYKHQGGAWAGGYGYKNFVIKFVPLKKYPKKSKKERKCRQKHLYSSMRTGRVL